MALDSYLKVVRSMKEASQVPQSKPSSPISSEVYAPKEKPQILDAEKMQEAQQRSQAQGDAWKTCEHLMEKDGEFYCRYFVAKCGKERCNKRFLSLTKKIPKL